MRNHVSLILQSQAKKSDRDKLTPNKIFPFLDEKQEKQKLTKEEVKRKLEQSNKRRGISG